MHSDPIADMLARINNAAMRRMNKVSVPHSKMKQSIAELLKEEGYVAGVRVVGDGPSAAIEIDLKYTPDGRSVIRGLRRVSKPSRRIYRSVDELQPFRSGLGIRILTTSKGIMTDSRARKENCGGEVICEVW